MSRIYRSFNAETGVSEVMIKDKFGVSFGRAKINIADKDLPSEKTGLTIAELKARIERERKRKIKAKNDLEKTVAEVERLQRHLEDRIQKELELKEELKEYLNAKEDFRKSYRQVQSKKNLAKKEIK